MCILHYFRSQNFELLQRFAESVFAFYLESLEVVDKHIWHPKVIDEVQIYGLQHLLLGWPTKTDKKLIFEDLEYLYNMSSATYFFRTTHVIYSFLPVLEEAWIYLEPRFFPPYVEIQWKSDTEVAIIDF